MKYLHTWVSHEASRTVTYPTRPMVVEAREIVVVDDICFSPVALPSISSFCRLLQETRSITLTGGEKDIEEKRAWYDLSRGDEVYLVSFNSLPSVPIAPSDWKGVFLDDFFDDLSEKLASLKEKVKESKVVVAFYEILTHTVIDFSEESEKALETEMDQYYQGKFVAFQGFKHAFFESFPDWESYKELPIIYDLIVVSE
jgi:hypothetical protein